MDNIENNALGGVQQTAADENYEWYILHTNSGYENVAEENLRNMVENNKLQNYIVDIRVPMEEKYNEKKKKTVQKIKFPSYIFIKMVYTNNIWFMVTNTRGVTGFVGPKGRPLPMTADEVKRMNLEVISVEDFDIKVGDNVKVISGALNDFIGVVEEISGEKQKVKVIVSMFGRETPVELNFSEVEKI